MAATRFAFIFVLALLPGAAAADDRVALGVTALADTDGLIVAHPAATARIGVTDDVHVSAGYEADVISAATVDVRTAASTRPFEEVRHGGRAGLDARLARLTTLSFGYALSLSPDHASSGASVRLTQEDDARVHTLTVGLAGAYDAIGRVGDPGPTGEAGSFAATVGWGVVLSSVAVASLGVAVEHRRGYLESPYRFVTIGGAGSQVRVPEEVPDERWRGALSAGLRVAVAEPLYLRAGYRLHADDWGVVGHTVDVAGHLAPARGWLVTVSGQVLAQAGASFYSGAYATLPALPALRTRDRTLSPHHALGAGVELFAPLASVEGFELGAEVRGRLVYHRYLDTPLLPERTSFYAAIALVARR